MHGAMGLTWSEWASIITILGAVVGLFVYLTGKLIIAPALAPIEEKLTQLNANLSRVIERQDRAERDHEKRLEEHERRLNGHSDRIDALERQTARHDVLLGGQAHEDA